MPKTTSPIAVLLLSFALAALGPTACKETKSVSQRPIAGPLQAGIARVRMPVPVGIGTVGYGGFTQAGEPSPFADIYPATTRLHGHPQFRVVLLSRGPGHEVIFIRSDTVGIFQHFRRAVALEVEQRLGRSIDDALIFGGTHTHSGPGRVIQANGPPLNLIADNFFPEFYERMVDVAAGAIMDAYADLAPARVGHVWADGTTGHSDRRCEDGRDYTNGALPVIAVERNGAIDALVFAFAIHGTVLDLDDFTLSRDVSGAIEQFIEQGFTHPVMAMFFNSWGADMAPGSPTVNHQTGAAMPSGYERMHEVGRHVADRVHAALPGIVWEEDPEIFAEVHRVHLNRDAIGYAEDEFDYPWGGVYCGGGAETDCDPNTVETYLDTICLPFSEAFPVPQQTEISAGRVGGLAFVTYPGEPGTLLAEKLLDRLASDHGHDNVAFFGYTQDYTGYSILEDDWWQGGYEAGGHIWGPRQGEYLVDMATDAFYRTVVRGPGGSKDARAPAPIAPFVIDAYAPYAPASPVDLGAIVVDASALVGVQEVVSVTVAGADPWLGTPWATLVDATTLEPVLGPSGRPIDSDDYAFWIDLSPTPGYADMPDATARQFNWTISFPVGQTVPGLIPDLSGGAYRLRLSLPHRAGVLEVDSRAFRVQ